jgi:HK97 gp10 family phage protein
MSDSVSFSIIGLDSLLKKLESVTYDVKRKGGRAALRKAAQVVEKAAKSGAQRLDDRETGRSIASNVAIRWNGRLFKRTGDLGFRVGVLHGAVLPKRGEDVPLQKNAPTPHWRIIEFGSSKMQARPFMRPALESNISEVTNTFVVEYGRSIDRAIKRVQTKK